MIDLLILYMVSKREFTMYAIQKGIESEFGVYTRPSFGALKPALRRLEFNDFIATRKIMSDGGKLSVYYSTTKKGVLELKRRTLEKLSDNPLQFHSNAKIKLACAEFLDYEERKQLFFDLKSLAMNFKVCAQNILDDEYTDKNFYQKILLDNTICEYSNLITIIEGFEKDNERNRK